jgi:glutamine cyclotransferase
MIVTSYWIRLVSYKGGISLNRLLVSVFFLIISFILYTSQTVAGEKNAIPTSVANYTFKMIASYPHDSEAFTQGLAIDDGLLYEGTGRYGFSSLRWVDLQTGKPIKEYNLPRKYFGEGITVFDDKIIQLTWKSNVGFVYDKSSFRLLREVTFLAEGWGITHDGTSLIMSDGTAILRFLDPESFEEKRRINIVDDSGPVGKLNELEYVKGKIYANVWQTDKIAIIDPERGRVTGWLDMSGLLGKENASHSGDVLNGIAYDPEKDSLYVTGKLWPRLFEIEPVLLSEK